MIPGDWARGFGGTARDLIPNTGRMSVPCFTVLQTLLYKVECMINFTGKTVKIGELYKQICTDKCAKLTKLRKKLLEKYNLHKMTQKEMAKPT